MHRLLRRLIVKTERNIFWQCTNGKNYLYMRNGDIMTTSIWLLLRDSARAIFRGITVHIGPIPVYTLHVCKDSVDGD